MDNERKKKEKYTHCKKHMGTGADTVYFQSGLVLTE
jgi:hypothetical protein